MLFNVKRRKVKLLCYCNSVSFILAENISVVELGTSDKLLFHLGPQPGIIE